MESYSNHCVCVCVLYTCMCGTRCERSELQVCCKNVSSRRYGSFNGHIELHHFDLLMSTEKL